MDIIVLWAKAEMVKGFCDDDCNSSQLHVLGPAKARKLDVTKAKA